MELIVLRKNRSTIPGKITTNASRDDILPAPQSPPLLGKSGDEVIQSLRKRGLGGGGSYLARRRNAARIRVGLGSPPRTGRTGKGAAGRGCGPRCRLSEANR